MIARDIADRARVERASRALLRELERKNAELERANADLSRFAYVASHDLSEPLRSISGFAQLVERRYGEAIDEEGQDYLHRIVAAAARLRNLIDALLAYSRTGRTELQVEQVDLNALLSEVVRSLAPLLDESGAVVDVADLPTVAGDASLLAQVFQNLISNAVKFRRDVPPRVRVRAEREDGRWRLHVADNGVGIEERHRERVFEIFSRLHAQGEYPGTGIGLAVVRAIAERHGGSAGMAPEQGGSDFWITIPIPEELDATESPGADTPGGGQLR
jgi:light-regulated signal transduction histidine kinase (bacteriophytochrome)